MVQQFTHQAGKAPEISDVRVVALYDPGTGRIAHVHTITTLKAGRVLNEKEVIESALAHATKAGCQTDQLQVKLSNNPTHGHLPHKIDIKTQEFVALNPPSRT
ncbi:MAG: hypothetical protein HWQ41_27475 [Nostoc sp. NOS(2021)]|uniref:hypothetical protein n=1 Tax=Nostoc sp. NOS(2021) TaxID=2815407 RepID=UPI0025EDE324|nr:hypothetical protein [Nostoc sp. NOS(2021)]MBN3898877.1 hypothetical protein [Nostoc sp. NOS(2021)]